jgi:predicted nuclease of restriction endonuclease-like RecB superfamily
MAKFGKVRSVQAVIGGKTHIYRSKMEYRWAVWCQIRKEQDIILDWWYELEPVLIKYKTGKVDFYRPDFTIEYEDRWEYEETKGWFTSKDYTKIKLFAEQYENPLTLIFANLTNCKSGRTQYNRAKRLEKLLTANGGRVIYDADKTIFKPIRGFF